MSGAWVRARSLEEALETLAEGRRRGEVVTPVAGCTDWMVERHLGAVTGPDGVYLDLTAIPELTAVEQTTDTDGTPWIRLGAAVTYRTLRTHPVLTAKVPILGAMAMDVGAVQIQARGTLGGNLATASPAADGVPVLAALGALVSLARPDGTREVSIDEFYTAYKRTARRPDELITAVSFRVPPDTARWYWRKVGTRRAQSISKVALAGVAHRDSYGALQSVRFGMASVGPTVALLPSVRAMLTGRNPRDVSAAALTEAVLSDIAPITDVRSTEAYRRHVACRTVVRMVEGW